MNRVLLPLLLIIISVASYFMWISPHYENTKILGTELKQSQDALDKVVELEAVRASLEEKEKAFNQSDLAKLQKLLPDNVDNIRLFLDIQGIAAHYNTSIQDISVGDKGAKTTSNSSQGIGPSTKQYGQMTLGFSINTSYENLGLFLKDLEKSLRLVEIKSIGFSADNRTPNRYKVTLGINAFWLSPKAATVITSSQ